MRQIQVLKRGPAVVVGLLGLYIALGVWGAVFYDIANLGFEDAWSVWTGTQVGSSTALAGMPMTTVLDVALGVALVTAAAMALSGSRTAGGALAATLWIAIALRVPTLWSAFLYTEWMPWYRSENGDSSTVAWSGLNAAQLLFFLAIAAIVLLAGRGPAGAPVAPPRKPLPQPMRPGSGAALTTAGLLTVFALFGVGWNIFVVVQVSGDAWLHYFTGAQTIFAGLGVGPAWLWILQAFVCATGAVLAATRSVAARGFGIAVAAFFLVAGLLSVIGLLDSGTFFELGDTSPGAAFFSRLGGTLEVVGSIAIIVLMARPGQYAELPGAPAPAQMPAPMPGGYPVPVQQQPAPGWQPQQPQPSGYGYGYPAPPAQPPAPPAYPPQQGGGFGPPPQL